MVVKIVITYENQDAVDKLEGWPTTTKVEVCGPPRVDAARTNANPRSVEALSERVLLVSTI